MTNKNNSAQSGNPKIPSGSMADDETIEVNFDPAEEGGASRPEASENDDDVFGSIESPLSELDESSIFDDSGILNLDDNPDSGSTSPNLRRAGMPRNLNAPDPRPGFVQKFVLFYDKRGKILPESIAKAKETGWKPRKVNPGEYSRIGKIGSTTVIVIKGHVLCEMPEERAKKLRKLVRDQTAWNAKTIGQDMRSEGRNIQAPTGFKQDVSIQHGSRGRKVQVAPNRDDDE